jgi:hypothetical protein
MLALATKRTIEEFSVFALTVVIIAHTKLASTLKISLLQPYCVYNMGLSGVQSRVSQTETFDTINA